MAYMSIDFMISLAFLLIAYYLIPMSKRWIVLLCGSVTFYYTMSKDGFFFLALITAVGYIGGKIIHTLESEKIKRVVLAVSILITIYPLFMIKGGSYLFESFASQTLRLVVPLGISFYTLQIIAYLVDVYKGKEVEENFFKFTLFVSFFPQVVQGPIPRFERLQKQLLEGHSFNERTFVKGAQLILWGWFLKLMIADKAAIVVDTVFGNSDIYTGSYVLLAGVLYSVQLYVDFSSCVCIAKGIAELFGIELEDNFNHPYFSKTIAEFWRRWHITLSSWLRDYIYISLGGNRKGVIRKYINILVVFIVSGIWHGDGQKFLLWGLLHGMFQVAGGVTKPWRDKFRELLKIKEENRVYNIWRMVFTFVCVMFGWIIFRAESLEQAGSMILSVFTNYNPWIFFDDSIFNLGLSWKEFLVLVLSILTLWKVSMLQEKMCIRDKILESNIVFRWTLYITAILVIMVFGTYGYGFDAKDFIYGGF